MKTAWTSSILLETRVWGSQDDSRDIYNTPTKSGHQGKNKIATIQKKCIKEGYMYYCIKTCDKWNTQICRQIPASLREKKRLNHFWVGSVFDNLALFLHPSLPLNDFSLPVTPALTLKYLTISLKFSNEDNHLPSILNSAFNWTAGCTLWFFFFFFFCVLHLN